MKMKKILCVILMFVMILTIINIPTISKAEYKADKEWSTMKVGDVIYFDNTGLTDWDEVYIHLWYTSSTEGGESGHSTTWPGIQMTKISDHLYSYTVDASTAGNNMLLFHNRYDNGLNQTQDLGFIETNFVFKTRGTNSEGKRSGYWYLYDKSEILSHLENVKKYQEDKKYYTEESYKNLDELILNAVNEVEEIVLEMERDERGAHTGKYYISIGPLLNQIDDIIKDLEIDTKPLEDIIEEENKNIDDYENKYKQYSVEDLKDELEDANDLLENPDITVDDIKKAIEDIEKAKENLKEKADKTELEKKLEEEKELDKSPYTDESVKNLEEQRKKSQEVYDDENATQEEVDESTKKLQEAIDALEKKEEPKEEPTEQPTEQPKSEVDKSKLKDLLDEAAGIDEDIYTEDSVNNLKDAMGPAQDVYDDEDVTQEQVDEQVKKLQDAIDALEPKEGIIDRSRLKRLLDKAAEIDEDIYTEDSVNNLKDAMKLAQEVYDDENATQEQIDEQVKKLRDALDALKEKETDVSTNNPENNNPVANNDVTPKTGDMAVIIFGSILVVAIIIFVSTWLYGKKRKQK